MSPYVIISSRTVRDVFNKEHKNVLRDIERVTEKVERSEERTENLDGSNFRLV